MNPNEIEPLTVTTETGEAVDLTALLHRFQAVRNSAMQSREHDTGKGFIGVSKDTVAGVGLGMQLAVDALYGSLAGKAFERRINPDLPDWMYQDVE